MHLEQVYNVYPPSVHVGFISDEVYKCPNASPVVFPHFVHVGGAVHVASAKVCEHGAMVTVFEAGNQAIFVRSY